MDKDVAEQTWEDYRIANDITNSDEHKALFIAGLSVYERLALGGNFEVEWGIAYVGSDIPVDPIRNPKAARGIFSHYGTPGDKLVKRSVGPWKVIEECSAKN